MTQQEQQLIDAIKAKPGHQVFANTIDRVMTVARTTKNSVAQQTVWLGRRSTIDNLQRILAA